MALNCPGMNPNVLPNPEKGDQLGDGATQAAADQEAKTKAEAEALGKAFGQFAKFQCPPPCISVPIVHLVGSGALAIPAPQGATHFMSAGWAHAQLDVLCIALPPAPPAPPAVPATPPQEESWGEWLFKKVLEKAFDDGRDDYKHHWGRSNPDK